MKVINISLGNSEASLYSILILAGFAAAYLLSVLMAPRHNVKRGEMAFYGPVAALLALLLGRLIYCLAQSGTVFYDAGAFQGLSPFFDLSKGSVSVIGVIFGFLLAAPVTASVMKGRKSLILDAAAIPALLFFAFARAIEPLSGQGWGISVETEALRFFPLTLENGCLAVCYIEALLALILAVVCIFLYPRFHHRGTLFLTALTLLSASQLVPESFRRDSALFIFGSARVNQIGFAIFLALALAWALVRCGDKKRILRHALIEYPMLLCFAGIFICGEFTLEGKLGFQLPSLVVYLIMIASSVGMAAVALHRIRKEEMRHRAHHHHHHDAA